MVLVRSTREKHDIKKRQAEGTRICFFDLRHMDKDACICLKNASKAQEAQIKYLQAVCFAVSWGPSMTIIDDDCKQSFIRGKETLGGSLTITSALFK